MKTAALFFISFLWHPTIIFSQVNIAGIISDHNGKALYGASITAFEKGNNTISSYSITLNNGQYKIILNSSSDSIDIIASHIGYKEIRKRVVNKSQQLSFALLPTKIEMPNIVIENKLSINKKGDTLNYDVKTFTVKTDRVIADVLKKLPGIEIDASGQVRYNGKPITNYYIEGLDLLENRYNIANQNIPADIVEKVQILENHQPIKALDSTVFSDRAAINLKLTKAARDKFFSTAKIGAGISSLLWQNELLTFNFRKKFQFISGYKTNNIGINLGNELNSLTSDQFDNLSMLNQKQDLVALLNPSTPPFEDKRYLFNKTHLVYSNGLFVTGKSSQLKYNISYLNNNTRRNSSTRTLYYLPQDTLAIIENQQQDITSNKLFSNFGLTINKANFYLKDNLKFEGYWDKAKSEIVNLIGNLQQQTNTPLYQVINNFHIIFSKKKNSTELNSNIIIKNTPQQLTMLPGPFSNFFNQGMPYESLKQEATQKTAATENYLQIRKHLFAFTQRIKLGFALQNSSIASAVKKDNANSWTLLGDSMKNDLKWREIKPYTELGMYILKGKCQIDLTSTLVSNTILDNDLINNILNRKTFLLLNNSVKVKQNIGAYYNFAFSLRNENNISSVNQNTIGYIVTNYRTVSRNNFTLQKSKKYAASLFISYRNPLKTLFGYFSSSYNISQNKLLPEILHTAEFQTTNLIKSDNQEKSVFVLFNGNKIFKKSKTSIGLNGLINNTSYPQLQQNNLSKIFTKNTILKLDVNTRKFEWLFPELNTTFTRSATKINSPQSNITIAPINQITENINLNFFITKELIFTAASSYYYTKQAASPVQTTLFFDCYMTYKKGKYNFDIKLLNLSNIKNFKTIFINENMQSFTNYKLRSTNVLAQFSFRF
ncbi:carboxypeptidase-like regulatory domain-containing protein [Ferruginibacter sp. SUN106]|uniref:carboxypeptidase-like regulatory domain-containing protein n=1 Tax=Ferruginibacter sp. SUN106 TaxID=2978348 RepID=UPI003D359C0F